MNKLKSFFLAVIVLANLTSCSKDEDKSNTGSGDDDIENVDPNLKLLKKLVVTNFANYEETSIFTYSGNKIVNVMIEKEKMEYYYTGNLITKTKFFLEDGRQGSESIFTYDGKKLIQADTKFLINGITTNRTKYKHLANGIIEYEVSSLDANLSSEFVFMIGSLTFKDNNLMQAIEKRGTNFNRIRTCNFEYDDKISPLKNIEGYLLLLESGYGGMVGDRVGVSVNNVSKWTIEFDYGSGVAETLVNNHTYKYTDDNYPITYKDGNSPGKRGTVDFFY